MNNKSTNGINFQAPRSEVVLVVSRWKADGLGLNTMIKDSLVATFKNTIRPPRIPELTQQICDIENLSMLTHLSFCLQIILKLKNIN